ncbi:synaptonemal complex protein 1 [Sparus aurata]|uniref:Synaptonemal complex protein 1 n=1 Tax=Sparus aurata TaxID=8175 RepID=A0A671YT32_SPAAU|nr:synaptonemal complex protein 1 [Sparus aurata]XP_030274413.1 synaptonemal complex protein 1 [Sparus aurata]XP_030274414.1 synaptonemal complex protein 1 [Sparus aurata]XP_030274415.1 synaptonemal complex protein 1 [Sparus aurata]XP_030274416.1 synaptonemal complex protein 1 [Sparus aurata]
MDRDRGFNFKLLVPPRVNNGQVSAVRPQEIIEGCGDFVNKLQQGHSKCFDKEQSMPFPNTSMVAPTKPTRQEFPKMKVVPPMEKDMNNCNPGQLYCKLFDEVEKMKCWKDKADSDTVQKERRLQENKRTIETQRKAIQELQFGNESLSLKLEEQISENEDLRNKNNATRNLCNILKDTLERSSKKMHLFESEREETHHILMENSESIQKLIAAFESLRMRAEADQQEMQKVKEDLMQFESLKEKYHQEYNMKEKEVVALQTKLKDKESELQKLLLDLQETQKHSKQLQEETKEQYELLKSLKTERESILQELHTAEQSSKETEKKHDAIAAMLVKSEEEYAQMIKSKDLNLEELGKVRNQQAEKLEQIQTTIQELQNSLAFETQRAKELEDKLMANDMELKRRNTCLEVTMEQSAKKDGKIKILEDELDKRSKSIESMKGKIDVTEVRVEELTAELSKKTKEVQLLKNEAETAFAENDELKKSFEVAEKAQEDLNQKSKMTEIKVQELKGELITEKEKNRENTFQMEQLRKDIVHHETKYKELLSNFDELQSEKTAIQQQFESTSSNVKAIQANMKESEAKAAKLMTEIQRLEEENQCLREGVNSIKSEIQRETPQKEIEDHCVHLQDEIKKKEKEIKALATKLCNVRKNFEIKLTAQDEYKKENKMLKKQIVKETAKFSQLENEINGLQEESRKLKRQNKEDYQKFQRELDSKSTFAEELKNEVEMLRVTAAEAVKNKEDAELKCQHKIADMVALMEKHKSQYDRMVEQKDAELDENRKKEREAVACRKSLELDLEKHKTDEDQLKQQLKTEVAEKENLQKELTDLKNEMSSMQVSQLTEVINKQSPASNYKQGKSSATPKESSAKRHVFGFTKTRKTPSYSKVDGNAAVMKKAESDCESITTSGRTTPKTKKIQNGNPETPSIMTNRVGGTSKIKSYRIRTPPSSLTARWEKTTIELDPRSDSSDQNDILSFAHAPAPKSSAPPSKLNILQKSPVSHKSPGNSLKLAAMKRMRDAGWTAVTVCDKKKKKSSERVFA